MSMRLAISTTKCHLGRTFQRRKRPCLGTKLPRLPTLLLGGKASRTYKVKPLLIHTSANPRALKGITKVTLPVHFRSNKKAWITILIFEDWFVNCFLPEVEKYCQENNLPFKILLILDNAPGHPIHLDDISPNVKVVYLPPTLPPYCSRWTREPSPTLRPTI
jgi:hypothetical protein